MRALYNFAFGQILRGKQSPIGEGEVVDPSRSVGPKRARRTSYGTAR
jgi:hypothetical protein